ncbi:hypothetical protein EGM_08119 [Macaca fascicularis]|uniref:Uncharacterized protein n=1 Tax=Macaca fascicularis TaxID=9541 RepID=G7PVA2_MACFA|nr:hypothetical protein EGM_08119 [Macaca fascicularis]
MLAPHPQTAIFSIITIKNVSRHFQVSPGKVKSPLVENHSSSAWHYSINIR